jgi:hemophore-related protein
MNLLATSLLRGLAGTVGACAVGAVVAGGVALPSASAAPCKASGYASTASGVLNNASGYLDTHPGADDVLTAAANQAPADADASVRAYFTAHPNEYVDLKNIVQPLKDVRNQCGIDVTPSQLATLFNGLS